METTSKPKKRSWGNRVAIFGVSHGIWMIFIVLFLIGASAVPGFIRLENLRNVLWGNISFGFLVLGMFIVLLTGAFDLSIESTFAMAPIIAVLFMVEWAPQIVSPYVAMLITIIIGIAIGLFNGLLSVQLGINPFLVTLTVLLSLRGFAEYLIPEGIYYLPKKFIFIGSGNVLGIPAAIILFLVAVIIVYFILRKTVFGKNLYATGSTESAAYLSGINTKRIRIATFIIAGLFAAIGGIVETGRMHAVVAAMGEGEVMTVFAACFLAGTSMSGGRGEVIDLIGAILTLSIITNIMNLVGFNPFLIKTLYGLILLVAIIFSNMQQRFRNYLLMRTVS